MNKKYHKKKRNKNLESKSNANSFSEELQRMKRTMANIIYLLRDQTFASKEEANVILQKMFDLEDQLFLARRIPLQKAQDLIYDAWETPTKRQRVELARQALEISKDCADAYVLLAEETAKGLNEAKNLYEQGVKAGERALGPQTFKEDIGHFWGMLKTRPYMRARAGLAECLRKLGERKEAIKHYKAMLRLNPGDNQGIRYLLASCLLEEGDDKGFERHLKKYGVDGSAACLYPYALWLFRREGRSEKANAVLKEALDQNPFVSAYLLGRKRLPMHMPEYFSYGDENEAVAYASMGIEGWKKTPGALEWLRLN